MTALQENEAGERHRRLWKSTETSIHLLAEDDTVGILQKIETFRLLQLLVETLAMTLEEACEDG